MKSKEALERLKFIADKELNIGSKSYNDLQEFWNYKEPLEVIEQLVYRDTPKKPIDMGLDNLGIKRIFICPNCNSDECTMYNGYGDDFELNFCDSCGQRLDWSEEDE